MFPVELLIYIALGAAYLIMAGFVGNMHKRVRDCRTIGKVTDRYESCGHDHDTAAFFSGVFWPVSIALWLGDGAANLVGTKQERMEQRHARELAEEQHRTAMVAEQVKQTKILEDSLR